MIISSGDKYTSVYINLDAFFSKFDGLNEILIIELFFCNCIEYSDILSIILNTECIFCSFVSSISNNETCSIPFNKLIVKAISWGLLIIGVPDNKIIFTFFASINFLYNDAFILLLFDTPEMKLCTSSIITTLSSKIFSSLNISRTLEVFKPL